MYEKDVKIDNKMKTIITKDWLKEFPSYKKFRPQAWKKRVGPLSFHMGYSIGWGIDIKIAFSIFNLANAQDFMSATLRVEPKSRRYSITWKQHEEGKYKEAAEELRKLSPIPIEGPVKLSQVINAYKNSPELKYMIDERYFEDPALIAAWSRKLELAKELLDWGRPYYERGFGRRPDMKNVDDWYQSMLEKISDPEGLRKTVEEQVVLHKLTKVPYEDLVIDID
jgi:hypothetical protein